MGGEVVGDLVENGDEVGVTFAIGEIFPPVSDEHGQGGIGDGGSNVFEDLIARAETGEETAGVAEELSVADAPMRYFADFLC